MKRLSTLALCLPLVWLAAGCERSGSETAPARPVYSDVPKPAGLVGYTVVADELSADASEVTLSVALAPGAERDQVDELLRYLYRLVMTRAERQPSAATVLVFQNAAAAKGPPASAASAAVASVRKSREDLGPKFVNQVPQTFPKQVWAALGGKPSNKNKLRLDVTFNEQARSILLRVPYANPGEDRYVVKLPLCEAIAWFSDYTQRLFNGVPELAGLTYVGVHDDKDVLRISLSRAEFNGLRLKDVDEEIGAQQGVAYTALMTGRGSEESIARRKNQMATRSYRKMLAQLPKTQVTIDRALK